MPIIMSPVHHCLSTLWPFSSAERRTTKRRTFLIDTVLRTQRNPPPAMVPTLPYDIWCLIARYIPDDTLLTLYGVNSALFDIVMNEMYRDPVYFYHSTEACRRPCLGGPMDPLVPERIKALEFHPHFAREPRKPIQTQKSNKFQRLRNRLRVPQKKEKLKSQQIAACQRELQHCIEQMIQLNSIKVKYYPIGLQAFKSAMPLFATAWSTHGSRITTLNLSIPIEAYPTVFSTAASITAPLTDLYIKTELLYATTAYEGTLVSIAEFIQRHVSTLTNLKLENPSPLINPLPLFSNIPQLPCLTKLSLSIWVERLRPQYHTKVEQFLESHANSLTGLSLRFLGPKFDPSPPPEIFFSYPIFQVQFPYLNSLSINLCYWYENFNTAVNDNLVNYLRRFRGSLTKLSIWNHMLGFIQLKEIVGLFGGQTSQLRTLKIQIYFLSCSLLDFLYKQLPRLRSLVLHADGLSGGEDEPNTYGWISIDTRAAAFAEELAHKKYPDWALRRLNIGCSYASEIWDKCKPLLAAALPTVIIFNGVSREEFTNIPNATNDIP